MVSDYNFLIDNRSIFLFKDLNYHNIVTHIVVNKYDIRSTGMLDNRGIYSFHNKARCDF